MSGGFSSSFVIHASVECPGVPVLALSFRHLLNARGFICSFVIHASVACPGVPVLALSFIRLLNVSRFQF